MLTQALLARPQRIDGYVLPARTSVSVWRHVLMRGEAVNVPATDVHARRLAGPRLYAETQALETIVR